MTGRPTGRNGPKVGPFGGFLGLPTGRLQSRFGGHGGGGGGGESSCIQASPKEASGKYCPKEHF